MRGSNSHNTNRLLSTAGTFGEIDIVASADRVLIDATTRNYDTLGHLHHEHALANLSLDAAVRLRDLLSEAIVHAASVTLDSRQTAMWSDSTIRDQAERFGRRRAAA